MYIPYAYTLTLYIYTQIGVPSTRHRKHLLELCGVATARRFAARLVPASAGAAADIDELELPATGTISKKLALLSSTLKI